MGNRRRRKAYLDNWNRGVTGGLNYFRAANLHSPVHGDKEMSQAFSRPLEISPPNTGHLG